MVPKFKRTGVRPLGQGVERLSWKDKGFRQALPVKRLGSWRPAAQWHGVANLLILMLPDLMLVFV